MGGYVRAIYRAIELPVIDDEEAHKMTVEERHDVSGAITQGMLARPSLPTGTESWMKTRCA